jgi:D-glycero-beta-D-manno-heptose-7-phosphate kinase
LNRDGLLELLPRFRGKRILVVGDLFLDEYLVGRPSRISREAPVLVLEYEKRFCLPGGAANPARNIQSLGGEALMVGVVGEDDNGDELRDLLRSTGTCTDGIIVDPSRPTITKTRILARDGNIIRQQVVRLDRFSRSPLDSGVVASVIGYLGDRIAEVDAVLLSDYRSGVITDDVIEACRELARRARRLLTVDSQGDLLRFSQFGLVKCNQSEAEASLGEPLESEESFESACRRLLAQLGARTVVITRGGNGMSLMQAEGSYVHIPVANRSEVFDVTGAGDTAIAVLTLALASEAPPVASAHLANYAAGLVIRKMGNATTTVNELRETIASSHFPRHDPDQDFLR